MLPWSPFCSELRLGKEKEKEATIAIANLHSHLQKGNQMGWFFLHALYWAQSEQEILLFPLSALRFVAPQCLTTRHYPDRGNILCIIPTEAALEPYCFEDQSTNVSS